MGLSLAGRDFEPAGIQDGIAAQLDLRDVEEIALILYRYGHWNGVAPPGALRGFDVGDEIRFVFPRHLKFT